MYVRSHSYKNQLPFDKSRHCQWTDSWMPWLHGPKSTKVIEAWGGKMLIFRSWYQKKNKANSSINCQVAKKYSVAEYPQMKWPKIFLLKIFGHFFLLKKKKKKSNYIKPEVLLFATFAFFLSCMLVSITFCIYWNHKDHSQESLKKTVVKLISFFSRHHATAAPA